MTVASGHRIDGSAEGEWQATFDAIPDVLVVLSRAGHVVRANLAASVFLDRPLGAIQGARLCDCCEGFGDGGLDRLIGAVQESRCRRGSDFQLHGRWYRAQVDPELDASLQVRRFILLVTDITEEREARERLTQINETLKAYAHSVSHDLKGPLAGAATANQVLRGLLDQPSTDATKERIVALTEGLTESVNRSLTLINELLSLAENGAWEDRTVHTDVRAVVDRVIAEQQEELAARGVALEIGADLGTVPVAPAHLYQVFANLIGNAIEHNTSPTPRLRVARLADPQPGAHRFLVQDNGPGVPPPMQQAIFEPFVRGASGRHGIGLSTVKRIVSLYGGEVRVRNQNGACFELSICGPTSS